MKLTLEVEAYLRGDSAVAGAAATRSATSATTATTAWTKASKPTSQSQALAKERRREITDWSREVDLVE